MLDEENDFAPDIRALRAMEGLACCFVGGGLLMLACGGWQVFAALFLLYASTWLATNFGSRRDWRSSTRDALRNDKVLVAVDLVAVGAVASATSLLVALLSLVMAPASLVLMNWRGG